MDIKTYQHYLCAVGYEVACDGIWGRETSDATRRFQTDFGGITVDGCNGSETEQALKHAACYGIPERNTSETATEVQTEATSEKTGTFWDDIKYFRRSEFGCQCGGRYCNGFPVEPAEDTVRLCEAIRKKAGKPITISSGIRCTQHNAEVGGVSNSNHTKGLAADLVCSGVTPAQMHSIAESIMGQTGGLGLYNWGIHVDTGTYSRWNG